MDKSRSPDRSGDSLAAFLEGAVDAARAAGAVIQEGARNRGNLNIERKTANDFVSEIDKRAERDHETTSSVIRKALRKYLQVG